MDQGVLYLDRVIMTRQRRLKFRVRRISRFRVVPRSFFLERYWDWWTDDNSFGMFGGRIAFEYNRITVKFGAGLSMKEAWLLVARMRQMYPELNLSSGPHFYIPPDSYSTDYDSSPIPAEDTLPL